MSTIANLQKAIYSNLDTLQDLYQQAEGLHGLIEQVTDDNLKSQLADNYDSVIKTLNSHIDTTDQLIKALKKALDD